jgi:spermidine synthase
MGMRRLIIWSIVATGVSTVSAQLLLIREFLSQFQGNEITISLVLCLWLLFSGAGAFASKAVHRTSMMVYLFLAMTVALGPFLMLLAVRGLRDLLFIHGSSPGFYGIFFYIFVTTAPYCFLAGFILPYAQKVLNDQSHVFTTGELYLMDSIGDIAGAVLFSFPTMAIISGPLVLIGLTLAVQTRKYLFLGVVLPVLILFYTFTANAPFETHTLSQQYGHIVHYLESPYGRTVISKEGSQYTFWESGLPLYSSKDVIRSEEKVHYPLSQLDRVENVLLISGGLGETLDEVRKYQPAHVDYVELDPYLTRAALEVGAIKKDPSLRIINADGRYYIQNTDRKYDAVIIDLPDPDTFQVNRFFTSEFFLLTKKILKKDGILSFSVEYSPNYISEIRKKKISILYKTAQEHFRTAMILPGEKAYFLLRDGPIRLDVPSRLQSKGIKTEYVEGFFYGNVTPDRVREIEGELTKEAPLNRDFQPRLMSVVFQEWFKKHGTSPNTFFLTLMALAAGYILFMKKEEYVLFTTGLAAMGVEMLVVFTFQVLYGYIYLKIGAIISVFLIGLLPGALLGNVWAGKEIPKLFLSEGLMLLLLVLFSLWLLFFRTALHPVTFFLYCFFFSFLCGFQFPNAARVMGEKTSPAAGCLAADLAGASLGTLVTGSILIPLWGMQVAVLFLILAKTSSAMILAVRGRSGYQTV